MGFRSDNTSFDHPVGAQQHVLRNLQAERTSGLQVDVKSRCNIRPSGKAEVADVPDFALLLCFDAERGNCECTKCTKQFAPGCHSVL